MQQRGWEAVLREKYQVLAPLMNERSRRRWAAAEAQGLGRGGQTLRARGIGMSRSTVYLGQQELAHPGECLRPAAGRIRQLGGGRKLLIEQHPELPVALEALVEPTRRGDPQAPLRWTGKSVRRLAAELTAQGYPIGRQQGADLWHALGYSLPANRKTQEGTAPPDRKAQFEYLNAQVQVFQQRAQPGVAVDTTKKELVGECKNGGREWRPQKQPRPVRVPDFPDPPLGKAIPYGVSDLTTNTGWISVGIAHDTAEFAGETLRRWGRQRGAPVYSPATELLIPAAGGGSNGSRGRLGKGALPRLADELGVHLTVCHFPPGTSKWHKIEHRMFSHITLPWRGKPLTSHEVIVKLIANTPTRQGLHLEVALDTNCYPTGIGGTDEEFAGVNLQRADFHGEWNYMISPGTLRH